MQVKAAPFKIHSDGGLLVGTSMDSMKFVECPVVDNVPALAVVL